MKIASTRNFPTTTDPLFINKGPDNVWKRRAKEAVTNAATAQLKSRVNDHEKTIDADGKELKGW